MSELDLTAVIEVAAARLYTAEHGATTSTSSSAEFAAFADQLPQLAQRYRAIARFALEAAAPLIAAAERERILGTPDEPTGILDRYEVKAYTAPNGKATHMVYCGRCHHIQITARDLDGDQSGVTLAELAEWAMDHEDDEHDGEDHAAAQSSSPVEATNG
jgi:hypothetical protein